MIRGELPFPASTSDWEENSHPLESDSSRDRGVSESGCKDGARAADHHCAYPGTTCPLVGHHLLHEKVDPESEVVLRSMVVSRLTDLSSHRVHGAAESQGETFDSPVARRDYP